MGDDQAAVAARLRLRYGPLGTLRRHYTAIAEGVVQTLAEGFPCRPGSAYMGINLWASSLEQSVDMVRVIGRRIGFAVTGTVQVYETEPHEPATDSARGYGITFTPFDPEGC
jgi:hypothetical protein